MKYLSIKRVCSNSADQIRTSNKTLVGRIYIAYFGRVNLSDPPRGFIFHKSTPKNYSGAVL